MLLYIAILIVCFFQIWFQHFPAFVLHLLQSELAFQFPAGFHRAIPLVGVIYLFPFLVHAGGNDMDMPAVYVLVDIHDVRLVAVAHALHILPCQIRKLAIGQFVVHRRIKGYMQYGLFRILVGEQVVLECPKRVPHDLLRITRDIGNHAVA